MLSVGETLRRARLEQGLDLCTVAAQTKISAKYLEAIESDDRKRMPSGFFYRSFVEQYAKALSLDTHEIAAEVHRLLSADEPLPLPGYESIVARNIPAIKFSQRFRARRWFTSAATLVLVLAGCSGVYAWWHDARSSFTVEALQGHFQGMLQSARALTKSNIPVASQKVETPVSKPLIAASAAPPTPAPPAAVPVSLASDTKPVEIDDGVVTTPAPPSDYKVMLDLMAHEATWLSVSSDGKPVFSGVLQPNETKSVGGKQFAKMRVGNAAGIEVRLNGKLLGPLGARGQVLIVLFTPDNFQIVSPPKESD